MKNLSPETSTAPESRMPPAKTGIDAPFVSGDTPPDAPERERRIAEAAYYRYERRKGAPGDPMQDWLEAEAELDQRPRP